MGCKGGEEICIESVKEQEDYTKEIVELQMKACHKLGTFHKW
jgi:hypothetical protein